MLWIFTVVVGFSVCPAQPYDPTANPKAIVTSGKARFTVLTGHVIRLEYNKWTDAATLLFLNRNTPVPTSHSNDWLVIRTDAVSLCYLTTSTTSFDNTNIKVSFLLDGKEMTWSPEATWIGGNLLGTFKSLDGETTNLSSSLDCYNDGGDYCTLGLVSRDGFAVIDDTNSPQFDALSSSWPCVVINPLPQPSTASCSIEPHDREDCGLGIPVESCLAKGCCHTASESNVHGVPLCYYSREAVRDLYFFGHGHNYTMALQDFTLLAGKIPLPPRYAFGVYYYRYWSYSDFDEKEIVKTYREHDIPLDVLVMDMGWHYTFTGHKPPGGKGTGWDGYTWDPHLVPNARAFLDWCHAHGLHVTLNVHPEAGIQPWEDTYAEMARAMGIDPTTNQTVPFELLNKTFVSNWHKIVLGAREKEGVDFWWLDWGPDYSWNGNMSQVSPVLWMSYIFFTSPYHWDKGGKTIY